MGILSDVIGGIILNKLISNNTTNINIIQNNNYYIYFQENEIQYNEKNNKNVWLNARR